MPIDFFTPSGPGSVPDPYFTYPARGFYKMLNGTQDDTLPFWTMIDDPIGSPDDDTSYVAWAVCDGVGPPSFIEISTAVTPAFPGPLDAVINYIRVHYRGASGYDSNGNPIEPPSNNGNSPNGNTFWYGFMGGNPAVKYYLPMTFTVGAINSYSKTFYTKDGTDYGTDGVIPFTGADMQNFELYGPRYGYYWVTADKSNPINDNGHNTITQLYAEVSWEYPSGGASLLLT